MIAWLWMVCGWAVEPEPASDAPPDVIVAALMTHEAELLRAVERNDPPHYQRLIALRDVDRPSYVAALYRVSRLVERTRSDPAFAERVRQIGAREEQLRRMGEGFSSRPAGEQQVLRAQMVALATELVELKQAERRQRLEEMRARIDALQREIEQREADRELIVEDYVDRLVR